MGDAHLSRLDTRRTGWRCVRIVALVIGIAAFSGSPVIALQTDQSTGQPFGIIYRNPLPGARWVSPLTTITFRFAGIRGAALRSVAGSISISGNLNGQYKVVPIVSDDGQTLVLKPAPALIPGETVTVHVHRLTQAGMTKDETYSFIVGSGHMPYVVDDAERVDECLPALAVDDPFDTNPERDRSILQIGQDHLPADYPDVKITKNVSPSDGRIFINNWGGPPYIMILENSGEPVFYRRMPSRARDFKLQPTGLLTYRLGPPFNAFYAMDSTYVVVDTFRAGHGYGTDEHELQMLPNGHVLLIALDFQKMDLSGLVPGGKTDATVIGNHVQELDTDDNVVFEWRSWDHYDVTDAEHVDLTANVIDYVHMNSISIDTDGNIVVSGRHLSEVTKINRTTGEVMWRLGGKKNQFVFSGPGEPFSWQHDARAIGDGHYTVFSNGNWNTPPVTRVMEYQIDTVQSGAILVWEYQHDPSYYTWWMGNAQRLPNGNTVIGWADGSLPKLTEVTATGETVYEMDFVRPAHCYRVFRFPWHGKAARPYLTAEPTPTGVSLLFPVFGDSTIAMYYIYGDTTARPTRIIDSTSVPYANLSGIPSGSYSFRVAAKREAGGVTPFSNEEEVLVRTIEPGANMVRNGSFDDGSTGWELGVYHDAVAISIVSNATEYVLAIGTGGPQAWSVQLVQRDIPLVYGRSYLFSFEAYASAPRTIEAFLGQDGGDYLNYSKSGAILVSTVKTRYDIPFTMGAPTDYKARVVFNCGQSTQNLYFDNVSVVEVLQTGMKGRDEGVPNRHIVYRPYPNPFNSTTEVRFFLAWPALVRIRVLNLLGQVVDDLFDGWGGYGNHLVRWDASRRSSGTYILEFSAGQTHHIQKISLVR